MEKNGPLISVIVFLRFDRNSDLMDSFFRNFFRQCKEPSRFGFYRIAADQVENLLGVRYN